jgi:hypothetical protein
MRFLEYVGITALVLFALYEAYLALCWAIPIVWPFVLASFVVVVVIYLVKGVRHVIR